MTRPGRWFLSGVLGLSVLATACAVGMRMAAQAPPRPAPVPDGLQFRLSEGKPVDGADAGERVPTPPATRLSDDDADRILARLTALKALPSDTVDFALREASLPPPRAGRTIDAPFPPPPVDRARPDADAGALTVRRIAPQGDVPLADRVSVTFSQPMVAVTGQEDAARSVPVSLAPQPPGKWRWLGTQTLIFDAGSGKRLPMATTYTVTVPAGVKSVSGVALGAETKVVFQTPALRLIGHWPQGGGQRRDPVIWLAFDQKVDPDALLQHVRVTVAGKNVAVRRASDAEVAAVPELRFRDVPKERTLALRPVETLPGDQNVDVVVEAGAPSAEGPRRTDAPQSASFVTYGPLKVTSARCTWNDNQPCRPEDPWQIAFSNELDAEAFEDGWVQISPKAPGLRPQVYGNVLGFDGPRKGRTTYTITLSPRIRDVFGQTLGAAKPIVFKIGPAMPQLQPPTRPFVVLDPGAAPRALFRTVNLRRVKVRLHAVTPADWDAWLTWQNGGPRRGNPPGRVVWERDVAPAGEPDDWTETGVSLAPALENGLGNVIVWWEADLKRRPDERPISGAHWFQSTRIGLSAHADATDLYAWATDLATGKPLRGAQVTLGGAPQSLATAADGMARFSLSERTGKVLTVRRGEDTAFLPARFWQYEDGTWRRRGVGASLRWFVFDDRGLYKPGETVRVKGWIRRHEGGKTGALTLPQGMSALSWVLRDSQGNEVAKGKASVNAWAGFDLSVTLPKTMNLGQAMLDLGGYGHGFNVQEFRRPEFEVAAKSERPGPFVVGGAGADLSVRASYYAGGPLPGAPANWTVTASPTVYTPPGHSDFTFGRWVPWWGGGGIDDGGDMVFVGRGGRIGRPGRPGAEQAQTFAGTTDPSGVHRLHVDFDAVRPARPHTVSAQAVVQDVNRQALAGSTSVLVHPSERYVGLRGARLFVELGKPLGIEAIVCDIDGKRDAGREIRFHAARKEWGWFKGRWQEREVDVREWTVRSSKGPVSTEFTPKEGGTYAVRATVLDSRERPNETELTLWVAGGKPDPQKGLEQERVTIIPDRKEYQPGQSARLLAQAPFAPAEGLLTVRRNGIVRTERIRFGKASQVLTVPIVDAYLPNVTVQIDLVGSSVRAGADGKPVKGLPARPAFAAGSIDLSVSTASRKLTVAASPDDAKVEPGGKTGVTVTVKDASGKPVVGGEVAVAVVDESVLALAGWNLGDPVAAFHPRTGPDTGDWHLRAHLLLEDPLQVQMLKGVAVADGMAARSAGMGGGMMDGGGRGPGGMPMPASAAPSRMRSSEMAKSANLAFDAAKAEGEAPDTAIRVRENFDALAHFSASVKTGADGTARVSVTVPDNLTRYRIVAVAVEGATRAGTGEASLTARLPLMARPSAPRFLNFGDRFELPVVLQNQTDAAMTVDVAVRAANASLTDGRGRRVTVPANDRVEVRFPAAAARPGTARFQIAAVSGRHADAAEVSLPVWTPATTEAFATYGVIDDGAVAQAVRAPADAVAAFGGLEITTSSTALQELTDAYIYLAEYPYGCAEQIASRVLATVALRDVLTAFQAPGMPDAAAVTAAVGRDLKRLEELQNDDGSFGFWTRGERPWPYLGVHVAHALARARQKDVAVPEALWNRSMAYVKAIPQHIPADYPESCRRMIRAYALYVRNVAGDRDLAGARALLAEGSLDQLGPEVAGWMLAVLAGDPGSASQRAAIRGWLNNHATETAGAAHFAFSYRDASYLVLHSNRRADAIVLEALIAEERGSDLIPKLVRGLLDGRKRGMWTGTQENGFVLLALDRYFRVFEGVTPNFVARVWLGDRFAGEGRFAGRTTDRVETKVPMRALLDETAVVGKGLTIGKEGPGRLYYRIGMRYAPKSLDIAAADYGFEVRRTYEAVDKASDVVRGPDGVWTIKAGAKVRVRVTMVATTRRYHVALVDPLPAGFEALNPELRGTEAVSTDPNPLDGMRGWWPWWRWWEHQNLRDERAEAFTPLLWEGAYEFVYVCRATTPGLFVAPPAKAEEMYSPETFGRSASDKVKVR